MILRSQRQDIDLVPESERVTCMLPSENSREQLFVVLHSLAKTGKVNIARFCINMDNDQGEVQCQHSLNLLILKNSELQIERNLESYKLIDWFLYRFHK